MKIGTKVYDAKYDREVVVDEIILKAMDRIKGRWMPIGSKKTEEAVIVESEDKSEGQIVELRAKYKEVTGTEISNRYKNDKEYMLSKINS